MAIPLFSRDARRTDSYAEATVQISGYQITEQGKSNPSGASATHSLLPRRGTAALRVKKLKGTHKERKRKRFKHHYLFMERSKNICFFTHSALNKTFIINHHYLFMGIIFLLFTFYFLLLNKEVYQAVGDADQFLVVLKHSTESCSGDRSEIFNLQAGVLNAVKLQPAVGEVFHVRS